MFRGRFVGVGLEEDEEEWVRFWWKGEVMWCCVDGAVVSRRLVGLSVAVVIVRVYFGAESMDLASDASGRHIAMLFAKYRVLEVSCHQ